MNWNQVYLVIWKVCLSVLLVFFGIQSVPKALAQGEAVVVANSSVQEESLTSKEVKAIFLGKKSQIGGVTVAIVTLANGGVHKGFLKVHVGKTPSQFSSHWKKIVFTGKGKMPKTFNSEDELLSYVSNTKGAVGYASSDAVHKSQAARARMKIVKIEQ